MLPPLPSCEGVDAPRCEAVKSARKQCFAGGSLLLRGSAYRGAPTCRRHQGLPPAGSAGTLEAQQSAAVASMGARVKMAGILYNLFPRIENDTPK